MRSGNFRWENIQPSVEKATVVVKEVGTVEEKPPVPYWSNEKAMGKLPREQNPTYLRLHLCASKFI